MKDKTLFDMLNNLYYKKGLEYDKKLLNGYLATLWLSHDKSLLGLCNRVNKVLFRLPDEVVYKIYYDKIPKGKRFIKYIKKEKISDKNSKKLEYLKKYYNMSEQEAKMTIGV